jgi:NADH:quinone reductase (non-electrogenic)
MGEAGDKKRVLILGAGAAGISAALELKKIAADTPGLEVTLVDQRDSYYSMPFVWQVVSGSVAPNHISFPIRTLVRRGAAQPIMFKRSRIQGVDVDRKMVRTNDGELGWDYLVIALGSTTSFFGMADVEENSLTLKSLKSAVDTHNHILDNYEAAFKEEDEQRQRELLTFVVVGGGPTGIELAGAVQDFVGNVLVRRYPSLRPFTRVLLVEAQDTLLSGFMPRLSELAFNRLCSRGIEVLLNTRITKAWPGGVQTAHGQTIATGTVIWVAGVKPVAVVGTLPFNKAKDGRIVVNQYLEVPEAPGVYVLGDCAYALQEHGSVPYPATQQVADRQGPACARNIVRTIRGQQQRHFRYRFKGQLIYMGRNLTAGQVFGYVFNGFAAAMVRRVYYLWVFVSYFGLATEFKRKLGALRDWVAAYFYHRSTAHLE